MITPVQPVSILPFRLIDRVDLLHNQPSPIALVWQVTNAWIFLGIMKVTLPPEVMTYQQDDEVAGTGTDNGTPVGSSQTVWGLSRLSAWWMAVGIELERARPGHPQDNGAHERMHRDIGLELEALSRGDQSSLDLRRQAYNEQRPHEALGMRYPSEVYQKVLR